MVDRLISRRVGRWLREEDGRSQSALSAATGIPTTSLSHYLRGTRRWPASAVHAISQAFGTTICELYGVDEGHTRQYDRETRVREVQDAAVARLMAGHEQAPKAEQDFIREIAEAAERFRQRLVSEEALDGPVPASPAALTD